MCRPQWWRRMTRQSLVPFAAGCLCALAAVRLLLLTPPTAPGGTTPHRAPQLALAEATFAELLAEARSATGESLYRFDRPGLLLPLMRLSPDGPERRPEWRVRVAREWLRTQRLLVAATARNAVRGLPSSLGNLRRLRQLFNESRVLMVENDSRDGTRGYLAGAARADPGLRLLGCGAEPSAGAAQCRLGIRYSSGRAHAPGSSHNRSMAEEIDRGLVMSALRNMYLRHAYAHFAGFDLLLVIDPDVSWAPWNLDSIAQGLYYFKTRPQLQQLCANTIDLPSNRLFDPCTLSFFLNKRFGEDTTYPAVDYYRSIMHGPRDLAPVKVDSCFQAFAFYRLPDLSAARLQYGRSPGEWLCEHNTLSRQLHEVYIDPQMRLGVRAANIG